MFQQILKDSLSYHILKFLYASLTRKMFIFLIFVSLLFIFYNMCSSELLRTRIQSVLSEQEQLGSFIFPRRPLAHKPLVWAIKAFVCEPALWEWRILNRWHWRAFVWHPNRKPSHTHTIPPGQTQTFLFTNTKEKQANNTDKN